MSSDLLVVLLVDQGAMNRPQLAEALRLSRSAGFSVLGPLWDSINVMGSDGLSHVMFESERAALDWLGVRDGLLPLWHDGAAFELDLSIGRVANQDPTVLASVGDAPVFDECRLSVVESELHGLRQMRVWNAIEGVACAVSQHLGARFGYAVFESALEALFPDVCIHQRVAANRLPRFLPWLTIAPAGSVLASHLLRAAAVVRQPVQRRGSLVSLRLSAFPWQSTTEDILRASAAWARAVEGT